MVNNHLVKISILKYLYERPVRLKTQIFLLQLKVMGQEFNIIWILPKYP